MPLDPQQKPPAHDDNLGLEGHLSRPEYSAPVGSISGGDLPAPPTPSYVSEAVPYEGDAPPSAGAGENPVWTGWDVVIFALVAAVALFVGGIAVAIVFFATHGKASPAAAAEINNDLRFILPVQLFSYAVMVVTMYVIVRFRYRRSFASAIRWNFPGARVWLLVACGIALATVAQLSELVLHMPKDVPMNKLFSTTTNAYLMALLGVLIAPVVEELFFRGFLYPVLARRWGMIAGIVCTGALFACIHAAQLAYSWAPLLVLFVIGASLTIVRALTRSVAASTIVHMTYNFVLMAVLWVATGHFQHLERVAR